eukprot:1194300-Prorocentrum_minimum.AAC.3
MQCDAMRCDAMRCDALRWRHTPTSAALILYVVRTAARIDGYMAFLLHHAEWVRKEKEKAAGKGVVTGTQWASWVRIQLKQKL